MGIFSEKELLTLIDNVPDGLCIFNFIEDYPYIKFTVINKYLKKLIGYSKEELNENGLSFVYNIELKKDSIIKYFKKRKNEKLFMIKDKAGRSRLLKVKFSITKGENSEENITALVSEVSEDLALEQEILEIKENEAMMRKVIDNSLDLVAILYPDFKIKYISPSNEKVLGYPLKKLKTLRGSDWIHPEDLNKVTVFADKLIVLKKTTKCQFRAICADGSLKHLEILGKPLYNKGLLDGYIFSSRDVSDWVKSEENLKQSTSRYMALFNNVNDAIYLNKVNEDGRFSKFVEVNDVGCRRLGYTSEELSTMSIYDVLLDFTTERVSNLLDKISVKGNALYEAFSKISDGRTIPVEINSIALNLNNEKYILSISRDITERKIKEKAEEYERLRIEFFANISHELRTPVNVILSALQLFNIDTEDNLSAKALYKKYLPIMKQNCYRLVRLINNLIDVTKIDSGYMQLNLKNVNIVDLIENITLSVAGYIGDKGINLIFDTDTEEKIMACDKDKIERIMLNLISNAVKFTKYGGSIFVNLKDEGEKIIISVKDTGIGIAEENQSLIFDRFIQVDKSLSRKREGSGIGLSLVKSLIKMHNGTIEVKSEIGKGSEFIITLPVQLTSNKEENTNSDNYLIHDNVEKFNIEFSDIYSSSKLGLRD